MDSRTSPQEEEAEEEEIVTVRNRISDNPSVFWRFMGEKVPKAEIVFVCQTLMIFTVIVASVYNLSTNHPDSTLWTALLSSCLGYLLPNPTLKQRK